MDAADVNRLNIACRGILNFLRTHASLDGVALFECDDQEFCTKYISGSLPGLVERERIAWKGTFFEETITGLAPQMVTHTNHADWNYSEIPFAVVPASIFIFPVTLSTGGVYGYLVGCSSKTGKTDFFDHQAVAEFCALQLSLCSEFGSTCLEHHSLIEMLSEQAYSDSMTGLLNRNGWESAIASTSNESFGTNEFCSVFVVDIDGLKQINDTQGHAAGDEAICQTASRLEQVFQLQNAEALETQTSGLVARTGGDEFSAILFGCDDTQAEVISQSISDYFKSYDFGVSVGFSCCRSTSKISAALHNADESMYRNKTERKRRSGSHLSLFKSTG